MGASPLNSKEYIAQRLVEARNRLVADNTEVPPAKGHTSDTKKLTAKEREEIQLDLLLSLLQMNISEGEFIKGLRKKVLRQTQVEFAKFCGVSRKSLSDIESDKGTPTFLIMNKILRPFGLKVGIVPRSTDKTEKLIEKHTQAGS